MYLLDTNVVSELRRPGQADPGVRIWAAGIPATQFFLSVITVLEIEHGVLKIERRDARQGAMLRNWLDNELLPNFPGRVLPIDTAVARKTAALHVPNPRPERDALITATAMIHGLAVVTRNTKDFAAAKVEVINPWAVNI